MCVEDNVIKKDNTRKNDLKIENLGNLGWKRVDNVDYLKNNRK